MKKVITLIFLNLLIMCGELPHVNPLDPDYKNDNSFVTNLNLLQSEDLVIFKEYSIPFREEGQDEFDYFSIVDTAGLSLVDSSILNDKEKSDTTIRIYFIRSYSGKLFIKGILPNGKSQVDSMDAEINNPFILVGDTLVGSSSINVVEVKNTSSNIYDSLYITWINDTNVSVLSWDSIKTYSYIAKEPKHSIISILSDKNNNSVLIDTLNISASGYSPVIDSADIINYKIKQGDILKIALKMHDIDKDSFNIYASLNGALYDSIVNISYDISNNLNVYTFNNSIVDTGECEVEIQLVDVNDLKSTKYMEIITVDYIIPNPKFVSDSIAIPTKYPIVVKATDNYYDMGSVYIWSYKNSLDTLNSDSITITYDSIGLDTIIIHSFNKYGVKGSSDTLIISLYNTNYVINTSNFKNEINPGEVNLFEVYVTNSIGDTITDSVSFLWDIQNKEEVDSLNIDGSKITLKVASGFESPFVISVKAIINNSDTTNTIKEFIYLSQKPNCKFTQDTIQVLLGDSVNIVIQATDDESVDTIYVQKESELIPIVKDSIYKYFKDTLGVFKLYTWAVDNDGNVSDTDSLYIQIGTSTPVIEILETIVDAYIYDTITITATAYSGNKLSTVKYYLWDLDGDSLFDTTTNTNSIKLSKNTEFKKYIYSGCVNDLGDTSDVPAKVYINIDSGIPVITSVSINTNKIYIGDSVSINIQGFDPNGKIHYYTILKNDEIIASNILLDTTNHVISGDTAYLNTTEKIEFNEVGSYKLEIVITDNYMQPSNGMLIADTLFVDPGIPIVYDLKPDTVDFKDVHTYTISANDSDGSIIKYEWSTDSVSFNTTLNGDSTFTLSILDSGWTKIFIKTTDNDANVSSILKDSVYVTYNQPVIDSLVPLGDVWINDTISYKLYFHDTNDSIISVSINWGDGNISNVPINGNINTISVNHGYLVNISTTYNVSVTVLDNDSISISKDYAVNVKQGKPIVTILGIDTLDDNLFVNDLRKYYVNAADSNGNIEKIFVSWDGDNIAEDSIIFITNSSNIDTAFTKTFDTTQNGANDLRFWAIDDDSIHSDNKDTTINIRLGAPVLEADIDDTIWVVIDNGTGENYTVHINSIDTNGTINRFYWHEAATFDTTSGSCIKTDDSTRTRVVDVSNMHTGIPMHIYGKDDDNLMRGGQFIIFADSIPPEPSVSHASELNDIKISWSGKDAIEGDETEYQILCDMSNPPTTVISAFKAGNGYNSGAGVGKDYSFVFTPSLGTGTYYYQVRARDKRGSINETDGGDNFYYVQP